MLGTWKSRIDALSFKGYVEDDEDALLKFLRIFTTQRLL
jgi:hypothetical protein